MKDYIINIDGKEVKITFVPVKEGIDFEVDGLVCEKCPLAEKCLDTRDPENLNNGMLSFDDFCKRAEKSFSDEENSWMPEQNSLENYLKEYENNIYQTIKNLN